MFESNKIEPYRPLFILGFISAILGVVLWLFFQWGWIHFYPRVAHSQLMIYGFFAAMITGFLMTAVPRMTGVEDANDVEVFAPLFLVITQWVLALRQMQTAAAIVYLFQLVFVIFFIGRRFAKRDHRPPAGFVFIPFAFLLAITGILIEVLQLQFGIVALALSKPILFLSGQAFLYNLILGLGSRLIPTLCRLPNALSPDVRYKEDFFKLFFFALLFNASFILQFLGYEFISLSLRSVLILVYSFLVFKLHQRPIQWTNLGLGIRLAVLFIFLSDFLPLMSSLPVNFFQHLLYIGGFALITLMISVRVTLAHSGQSLDAEKNSKTILLVQLMLGAAAIFRVIYMFHLNLSLLIISAVLFLIAVVFWMKKFFKYLLS